jgi:transposase
LARFNPIEQIFGKLKALLRKATERSIEGLWRWIAQLVDAFTPQMHQLLAQRQLRSAISTKGL